MIRIKNVTIQLEQFTLKDITLTVHAGEYFVILGPTGAGKTVLLECVAGFHHPTKGEIWISGSNATTTPPEKRNVGYVPQDYVLFPFLNVLGNIMFGMKAKGIPKVIATKRAKDLARLVGIFHLLPRDVRTLSGGEKQRVALARALAISPKILLLDEPLSSLDVKTASQLRLYLRKVHVQTGITTLHVTHNLREAKEMADRIAVLNMGKLEQVGTPQEIFLHPQNEIVSSFINSEAPVIK